jgi:peroxiredoxin
MIDSTEWRGHIAPDFDLRTTSGDRFKLSENIGKKIIVLNFFATWCGPCRAEMPELNRYFNQHKADDFLLVGIDAEEKQDQVDGFMQELKLNFPAGIDQGSIQQQYGVSSFPTTVLIGVDGKVQFYESGALVNAEVAFDNLLQQNRQVLQLGKGISPEEYRQQAEQQPTLPSRQPAQKTSEDQYKLNERGKRIVARMDCPCGCDKKVQGCTCNTSSNIKKALSNEDFKNQPDADIMKALNKRFCSGDM